MTTLVSSEGLHPTQCRRPQFSARMTVSKYGPVIRLRLQTTTVWVYEVFAQRLGDARETAYMRKIGYGNAVAGGSKPFWVEGDLAISANEQISFLRRLYRNELPFKVEHQRLVKDVMVNEAGRDWILRKYFL